MTAAALDPEPTAIAVVAAGSGAAAPAPPAVVAASRSRRVWEWEGHVSSAVPDATADEAWALLSDFLAFHRWHPRVAACRLASGVPLTPGCVRYCQGTANATTGVPADWAHETLLEHDAERRFFRYEMNDNNMGFGLFFATFRVVPVPVGPGSGCELRWEFECEPVRGMPRDALVARLQAGLDGMAARVRGHVLAVRAAGAASAGSDVATAAAAAPAVVAAGLEAAGGGGELVVVKLGSSIAAV